ncbi:MAG: Gfo/Idh/MocA family oxidoreductase [bacterium]
MKLPLIYVTGANGFIGQTLVATLARSGYQVYALLRAYSIPSFPLSNNIHVVYGDLTNYASLYKSIPSHSIVVNLAVNSNDKILSQQVNVDGVINLTMACSKKKVRKFIQISSQATKIRVQGIYARTKNESDKIVKMSGLSYVILKPSLVYGGGARGLFNKIKRMIKLLPFIPVFGDGKTKIYPIAVHDFANIIEKVIEDKSLNAAIYDVGCEKPITYNMLYRTIAGYKTRLVHVPTWMGLILARIFRVFKNPPFYQDNVLGSTQSTHCNPRSIIKKFAYHPTPFKVGAELVLRPTKLQIAVVGLGKMGMFHLSLLSMFPNVEIVALVDTNKQLFSTVKSMGIGGNFYPTLNEAFKREKIDAVYIITPTFTHFDLLKEAVSHGAHVFLEKPSVLNADQAKAFQALVTKQVVHVGYTLLYSRIYQQVNKIIKSKRYGEVIGYVGYFEHSEVFGPKKGWMFNKQMAGGGVLMNPGPHFFSLLTQFFGRPKKVTGTIKCKYVPELDDEVKLWLNYGKFQGKVSLSWSVKGRITPVSFLKISFEKGVMKVDGKRILIRLKNGTTKKITEENLPTDQPIFNINPKANGEAFYLENKAFLDTISGLPVEAKNTLKFALEVETTIFRSYQNCKQIL